MADKRWGFDLSTGRYRDLDTGRFLPNKSVISLRDQVMDTAAKEVRTLADQAARGVISPETFRDGMRVSLRNVHGSEMIFGRGGVNAMTQADWGRLGQTLRTQYGYLEKFAADIPNLSSAQAMARANQYIGAAVQSYEKGRAAFFDVDGDLPAYPGDGSTRCGGYCRCNWEYDRTVDQVSCTWKTEQDGRVCEDCERNGRRWNPLIIPKTIEQTEASPVRLRLVSRQAAA